MVPATYRVLHSKICSFGPFPLVQRGKSHVTGVVARQLRPSIRATVEGVLR